MQNLRAENGAPIVAFQRKEIPVIKNEIVFYLNNPDDSGSVYGHFYPVVKIIKGIQTIVDEKGNERVIVNALRGASVFLDENKNPDTVKYEDVFIYDGFISLPASKKATIKFLELCEQNVESLKRTRLSKETPYLVKQDVKQDAVKVLNSEKSLFNAQSTIFNATEKEIIELAGVFGLDNKAPHEVIQAQLLDIAKSDPDFFIARATDDSLKQQAEVQDLITLGVIEFDNATQKYFYTANSKRIDIMQVPSGAEPLIILTNFLHLPDNKKVYETLKNKAK